MLTPQYVICFEEGPYELSPQDMNSVFHIINSKCRMPEVDYWMPMCFPSISEEGYLNMYYRSIGTAMGLLLISSSNDNIAEAVMMCQKIEISLQEEKLTEMIQKYAKMLPLEPKAFGFENVERVVVLNTVKHQFFVWGSKVFEKMNKEQRAMLNKVAEVYKLFLASEEKKFSYIEKIQDYFFGALYEQGMLIFIKQLPWYTKDDLQANFKRLLNIIKNDLNNLFI